MGQSEGTTERRQRVQRLRADWRKAEQAAHAPGTAFDVEGDRQREADALGSSDEIRAEAPDDLETRRGADQLEREIKRSRQVHDG